MIMCSPKIDVLVPVFNAEKTLRESLASISAQIFSDFRVLIVDDGSTDGSADILSEWTRHDKRFTVISKTNGGIVDALNLALSHSVAPLIARMDADDLALPGRFAVQKAFLDENSTFVGVGCRVRHIDEHGQALAGLPQPGDPESCNSEWLPAREPYIIHPFLMTRRKAIMAAGGYRSVPNSEDSDLLWRLRAFGRLRNLSDVLGSYRVHSGSISSSSVVGGRIMAIGSQLGALSARRREANREDIVFSRLLAGALRQAETLDAMSDVIKPMIDGSELPRFKLAAGVKLLELALYRQYRLDINDCRFIRHAFAAYADKMQSANRREVHWYTTVTASRMIRLGRIREAFELVSPKHWGTMMARVILNA